MAAPAPLRLAMALASLAVPSGTVLAQEASPFQAPPLADAELAEIRGGFTLPGGVVVDLGVVIVTDLNGQRLLQTTLHVGAGGATASSTAGNGTVTQLDPRSAVSVVDISGLMVKHMIGQNIGSIIANSGNGNVVDHRISVDLTLRNVPPLGLGSAAFRLQSPGIDAAILRATGG